MLILKKPETSELMLETIVKAQCCNCTSKLSFKANSLEEGARILCKRGWRAYETDSESSPLVCPQCVEELQEVEREECAA